MGLYALVGATHNLRVVLDLKRGGGILSDTQEGGKQPGTESPTESHQIPKYRLDEEIVKRQHLERELSETKALMQRLIPREQAPVAKDPPELEALKEENPTLYKLFKEQQLQQQRSSAALFQQREELDRARFIGWVGEEEANRLGPVVEKHLDELRRAGNFTMNRSDLYKYLRGQEAITEQRKPQKKADPVKETPKAQEDVPSSDPSQQVPTRSAASEGTATPSLEELEKKLENVIL